MAGISLNEGRAEACIRRLAVGAQAVGIQQSAVSQSKAPHG